MNVWIIEALVVAILFGGGAWEVQSWRYGKRIAEIKQVQAEATAQAVEAARASERKQTQQVQEALNAALLREAKQNSDARRARAESDGLRSDLEALRVRLVNSSVETCRTVSTVLTNVFGECSAAYQRLAEEADRLGNSARTLDAAWPK